MDNMLVKSKEESQHLVDLQETFETLWRYNMKLNPNKCAFGVSLGKYLGFMVLQQGILADPDKIRVILDMEPPKSIKEVQSLNGRVTTLNRFVSRAIDKCLPFFKTLKKPSSGLTMAKGLLKNWRLTCCLPPYLVRRNQTKSFSSIGSITYSH